jgi:thiol:disulfide interchange protein DsbC
LGAAASHGELTLCALLLPSSLQTGCSTCFTLRFKPKKKKKKSQRVAAGHWLRAIGVTLLVISTAQVATAQEAKIREALTKRLPNLPPINSVTKTPMMGLYEVRFGETELLYTDAAGDYLLQGVLVDLKAKRNLTQERMDQLSAIPFDQLPFKDAFTIKRGNGKRQIAVFEDPNCGFCKRFERDMVNVNDITLHIFLYPILGPDSTLKSKAIWCAKDRGQAFEDWMINEVPLDTKASNCDTTALDRNIEFGKKHRISGTPALFFSDGTRVPGAISAAEVEKRLAAIK